MKIRVHELAKKYNRSNKEFLDILHKLELEVSSHLSGLTDEQVTMVTDHFENINNEGLKDKKKKKKKITKIKEKKDKIVKEKKEKKKKGKRNEFTMNKIEEVENEVIEEDGVKLIYGVS